ncbi:protein FAM110C [Dasypus novemcinctus]|uniref:protein FAM110C n=1 Tax=Dasypus novemcinctus TaxID=9361 RepID=UPI00265E4571|nr:protein FAM110C [Dasypus novemcinctus]
MPAGVAPGARLRATPALGAPLGERLRHRGPEYVRQLLDAARPARTSAVERLAADRAKYVKSRPPAAASSASESSSASGSAGSGTGARDARDTEPAAGAPPHPARAPGPVARRAIARRPLRPDSLLIYRQKCEFAKGPGADGARAGLVRKLLPASSRDKAPLPAEAAREGPEARSEGEQAAPPRLPRPAPPAPAVPAPPAGASAAGPALRELRRRGVQRSQSDVSSRFSRAFAESDAFFQFCGLAPEVVEALGRENFSAGSEHAAGPVRSVSIATSDSGFSRRSAGDDGLQEEELTEQAPGPTSVIEKNARIIKWLYTCRRAREAPGPQAPA